MIIAAPPSYVGSHSKCGAASVKPSGQCPGSAGDSPTCAFGCSGPHGVGVNVVVIMDVAHNDTHTGATPGEAGRSTFIPKLTHIRPTASPKRQEHGDGGNREQGMGSEGRQVPMVAGAADGVLRHDAVTAVHELGHGMV